MFDKLYEKIQTLDNAVDKDLSCGDLLQDIIELYPGAPVYSDDYTVVIFVISDVLYVEDTYVITQYLDFIKVKRLVYIRNHK